ncbi:MAG: hypothetical protein LIP03_14985 [Bacteroidales bacterium]|nr:hypothetical protein [Bacteroidales bacterium]
MNFDVVTSIEWMPKWSTTNWIGNDRYRAYVRLAPGTEPASLSAAIRQMQERHQDLEQLAEAGIDLTYSLLPLSDIHNKSEENRNINRLLILLGAVLILVSVLNYVLMVVSSLISRTKEIAVNKCYGASWRQLVGMTLSESALHLALALILGAALVIIFRHKAEELLSASISALFSPQAIAIIAGLCVLVLAATVGILTWLYSRVPVAAAFSSIKSSKRIWKLCLLFAQFAASAYVVALLFTISKQYNYMMSAPMGYEPDNLLIISNNFASDNELRRVVNELESLPEVESASYASTLPFEAASGNNVPAWRPARTLQSMRPLPCRCPVSQHYGDTPGRGRIFPAREKQCPRCGGEPVVCRAHGAAGGVD